MPQARKVQMATPEELAAIIEPLIPEIVEPIIPAIVEPLIPALVEPLIVWGGIDGDLPDQTDLQEELDGKAATGHNHDATYEPKNTNIQSHVGSAHAPADAQKNSDILKAEIEAVLTGELSSHSHAGGGATTGTTTVNFGAFPGSSDASIAVTGQAGIVSGSIVNAHKRLIATADHSADEHFVEEWDVEAGNIVPGTGFTIYAKTRNKRLYGQWQIAWSWS